MRRHIASAKVTGSGRIGNRMRAEHVEMYGVFSSILDMFQCSAAAEKVVGNVQNVIGFVIGQFEFQDGHAIECIDESDLIDELMDECESAVSDGLCSFGNFELDGTVRQLWSTEGGVNVVRSMCDFDLACFENLRYIVFHLKSFGMVIFTNSIFGY